MSSIYETDRLTKRWKRYYKIRIRVHKYKYDLRNYTCMIYIDVALNWFHLWQYSLVLRHNCSVYINSRRSANEYMTASERKALLKQAKCQYKAQSIYMYSQKFNELTGTDELFSCADHPTGLFYCQELCPSVIQMQEQPAHASVKRKRELKVIGMRPEIRYKRTKWSTVARVCQSSHVRQFGAHCSYFLDDWHHWLMISRQILEFIEKV